MTVTTFRFEHFALDPPGLDRFLPSVLPDFLSRQRWSGARSSPIRSCGLRHVVPLGNAQTPAAVVIVRAEFADGATQDYQLAIGTSDACAPTSAGELARITLPDRSVRVEELLASASGCEAFLRMLSRSSHSEVAPQLDVEWSDQVNELLPRLRARRIDSEQSNTSIVYNDEAVLKVFRRLAPGENPDVEVTRFLTNAGFRDAPKHLGAVRCLLPQGAPLTLAGIQGFVANDGDGWVDATRNLAAWFDDPSSARLRAHAQDARILGGTTARLHAALVSATDPAFIAVPMTRQDVQKMHGRLNALAARAACLLAESWPAWMQEAVMRETDRTGDLPVVGNKSRIHGDFHLGQVLRAHGRWVIFDFEGEPSRPIQKRRALDSPLRDVAGMLHSYSYAATSALFARSLPGAPAWGQLKALSDRWEEAMRDAFLQGWRSEAAASFAQPEAALPIALLAVFELEKILYELGYEHAHRPDWLRIPLRCLSRRIAGAAC